MRALVSTSVAARFPALSLAFVCVEGLSVPDAGDAHARGLVDAAAARVRESRTLDELREGELFRAYRDFYWALGIDPTKTRPSGEALNRRVLNGRELPSINGFVDAYNAASLETGVSIGAYDLDRVEGDALTLRAAEPGEPFQPLLQPEPQPLAGGELVLSDAARIVNFYPYRDADATKITTATKRAVLVACGAPGVEADTLRDAADLAARHVLSVCGGERMADGTSTVGHA